MLHTCLCRCHHGVGLPHIKKEPGLAHTRKAKKECGNKDVDGTGLPHTTTWLSGWNAMHRCATHASACAFQNNSQSAIQDNRRRTSHACLTHVQSVLPHTLHCFRVSAAASMPSCTNLPWCASNTVSTTADPFQPDDVQYKISPCRTTTTTRSRAFLISAQATAKDP
jgi:hypothetical protein